MKFPFKKGDRVLFQDASVKVRVPDTDTDINLVRAGVVLHRIGTSSWVTIQPDDRNSDYSWVEVDTSVKEWIGKESDGELQQQAIEIKPSSAGDARSGTGRDVPSKAEPEGDNEVEVKS